MSLRKTQSPVRNSMHSDGRGVEFLVQGTQRHIGTPGTRSCSQHVRPRHVQVEEKQRNSLAACRSGVAHACPDSEAASDYRTTIKVVTSFLAFVCAAASQRSVSTPAITPGKQPCRRGDNHRRTSSFLGFVPPFDSSRRPDTSRAPAFLIF